MKTMIAILLSLVAWTGSVGSASEQTCTSDVHSLGLVTASEKVCFDVKDGFPSPFGFANTNRRVELAPGEVYVLSGWIMEKRGVLLFKISLDDQPWLATAYRINDPFYPVNDVFKSWSKYPRIKVRVLVRANLKYGKLPNGKMGSWMELVPGSEPKPAN